ncbi:hypothetical protein [Pelagicoccus mobilis]|uniref:Uncharacterized protein n=1 Tax=Pelagicoccus mobilis TaxID=415221 RepID=A0A934S2E9_9BACT|nr:hypothetical protein [Pelagicoccus mobilis]MBK1880618.1 hypothetical protein [Pelagicoccus mobilis]
MKTILLTFLLSCSFVQARWISDSELGFKIDFPDHQTYTSPKKIELASNANLWTSANRKRGYSVSITVTNFAAKHQAPSFEAIAKNWEKDFLGDKKEKRLSEFTKVASYEALRLHSVHIENSFEVHTIVWYFFVGRVNYIIGVISIGDDFLNHPDIEYFINSFAIEGPSLLHGTWEGKDDEGQVGSIILNPDGSADLFIQGRSIREIAPDEILEITYKYDANHNPSHLDIEVSSPTKPIYRIPMIVKINSHDEIVIRLNKDNTRPEDWNGTKQDTVVLKKKPTNKSADTTPVSAPR